MWLGAAPRALSFHLATQRQKPAWPAGFCALCGWGGRIRTSVWRDQNPLPYHLATPQHMQALRIAYPGLNTA